MLGAVTRRLRADWRERYAYEPLLAETFIDPRRFEGTCYRAANWKAVGQTAGRDDGYANGMVSSGPKDVHLLGLRKGWTRRLCQEPVDPLKLR